MLASVITTIRTPTSASRILAERLGRAGGRLYVAGDSKGPGAYNTPNTVFMGLDDQRQGVFELARLMPAGHYCRKNVGYLRAVADGASCIYETDDDNAPLESWLPHAEILRESRAAARADVGGRWVNVYRYFSSELIWPRGFPLDEIRSPAPELDRVFSVRAPVQQGLANNAPDVDSVWRLTMDHPVEFEQGGSVYLAPGNWCPFNSQSTWWWPAAYPLMYIPSYCSFRMCDIWRSFVAQRCLWALGHGVVFHAPEVVQERNPHDLMRDFHDEIPGYERNAEMAELLMGVPLLPGPGNVADNLIRCYESLIESRFFPPQELDLVQAWLEDLMRAGIVV